MNYLLDTHTFIWIISDQEKLSARVKEILHTPGNSIFVSTISFWEIALKFSRGKLGIRGILPDELPLLSIETGFQLISPSADECASLYKLIITDHKDPFDRMLIWQSISRNFVFISKDKEFEQYITDGLKLLW